MAINMKKIIQISICLFVCVSLSLGNCPIEGIQAEYEKLLNNCKNYKPPKDYGFCNNGKQEKEINKRYDYIVAGGGTAGLTAAEELLKIGYSVMLLNAGVAAPSYVDIPGFQQFLFCSPANMGYQSSSHKNCFKGMNDNKINLLAGKVVGGTSAIDTMKYYKITEKETDQFNLENDDWPSQISQVQKYLEHCEIPNANTACHGTNGPVFTDQNSYFGKNAVEFRKARKQVDYNCDNKIGSSLIQITSYNGTRWNAAQAHPLDKTKYPKLTSVTDAFVTNLEIQYNPDDLNSVIGVHFIKDSQMNFVKVNKEVILASSSVNTVQLLLQSGIGPDDDLLRKGIECLVHLPDVGKGLSDKPQIQLFLKTNCIENVDITLEVITNFVINRQGLLTNAGNLQATIFVNLCDPSAKYADVQYTLSYVNTTNNILEKSWNLKNNTAFELLRNKDGSPKYPNGAVMLTITVLDPTTEITVSLRSSNPADFPNIKYSNIDEDQRTLVKAIAYFRQNILPLLQECEIELLIQIPSLCKTCDDDFSCDMNYVKHLMTYASEITGGCKIGEVVDREMKVYGMDNLRICDSSILGKQKGNSAATVEAVAKILVNNFLKCVHEK